MFSGLKKTSAVMLLSIIMQFPASFAYATQNADFVPYCISVTFNGNVQSCKGFTWYTDAVCASDLLLLEESENRGNDFHQARLYQGSSKLVERYTGRKAHKKQVTAHRLDLADLAADTRYVYKVGDAGRGIWSEPGTFQTAAHEDRFQFIITADSQIEEEQDASQSARTLRMAMQTIPEADFLIHLGDFVESYSSDGSCENFAQWQNFFAAAQAEFMNTTILPVAGNHDMSRSVFCNQFNLAKMLPVGANTETGAYYTVFYANTCFIVLNSNEGVQDGTGKISQAQIEWLKRTAALSDRQGVRWKILLMHRAIYSFGRHMDQADIIALRAQLAPLISDLGIDLVLQGHDHVYMRSRVMAKSASGQLVPQMENAKIVYEDFAGEKLNFTVNPCGTTYIIPNLIGKQFGFRKTSSIAQVYPDAVFAPDNNEEPVFAGISIAGNRLVYQAYAYAREGTGQVTEIDRYAIRKDQETEISQLQASQALPEGAATAVEHKQIRQLVQGFF